MSASATPKLRIKHDELFDHSRTPEFKAWVLERVHRNGAQINRLAANGKARDWDEHLMLAVEYLEGKPVSLDSVAKMNTVIARICVALQLDDKYSVEELAAAINEL